MHDSEKSDSAIVAVKPPNKAGQPVAEAVEPRAGTKGNADQQSTYRTQSRKRVIQALSRVRQTTASPSNTQGRSRMLELGSSGSVPGGIQKWASLPRSSGTGRHCYRWKRTTASGRRRSILHRVGIGSSGWKAARRVAAVR